jgi:type II secretory pathway component GspD/PulD (secretin)
MLGVIILATGIAVCSAQEAQPNPATQPQPAAGSPPASQTAAPQATGTTAAQPAATTGGSTAVQTSSTDAKNARQPTSGERRKAAQLYLSAAKLYEEGHFEEALLNDQQAAVLDPTNRDYRLAVEVARSHAITALIQTAAKARTRGDVAGARAALSHAFELDPHNEEIAQHLDELGDNSSFDDLNHQQESAVAGLGGMDALQPTPGVHSFHVRAGQRQVIQDVFRAYGIEATTDQSIRATALRFDIDDASFAQATRALSLATTSFFVPIDAHRALVAMDTRENRRQFTRSGEETLYLPGMTATEMTDMGNLAKNVFEVSQSAINPTAGTLTLRAPASQLNAFNATYQSLMDGRSQVLLDVKLIQLARNNARLTGVQLPQQVTAFSVYAEEQSILNANAALVAQIISSGLAAPGDTLAILAILLASGQVSSPLLQNGVLLFGNGITASGLSISPLTINLNLNSSDSRELDHFQLRMADGEEGTLKSGTRYPIMTSTYSNLGAFSSSIPGLNSPGNSTNLTNLASSLTGTSGTIPMVEYQDLGLVLKTTPSIMRSGEVALKIDLKISALAGSSINGVPILANRAWSGVVTVGHDQAVVVASQMDSQETHAVSGTPGLSEVPGLNNITTKNVQKNYSTLLIVMSPQVVRSPRRGDHTPMVHIDPNVQAR